MMQLLALSGAVLAVLVVLNLLLTFALIGRIRVLQALVEKMMGKDPSLPQPGDLVGRFEVTTPEGELLSDAALRSGVSLVGFFAPNCEPCAAMRAQLLATPPPLPLVAIVEGSADDAAASRELGTALSRVARVFYATAGDSVTRAFRSAGFPTLIRVENGMVTAAGHKLHDVLS
jgi:thiol-disulfide isomerase/thioredoxin